MFAQQGRRAARCGYRHRTTSLRASRTSKQGGGERSEPHHPGIIAAASAQLSKRRSLTAAQRVLISPHRHWWGSLRSPPPYRSILRASAPARAAGVTEKQIFRCRSSRFVTVSKISLRRRDNMDCGISATNAYGPCDLRLLSICDLPFSTPHAIPSTSTPVFVFRAEYGMTPSHQNPLNASPPLN